MVIAHRGYRKYALENTISAFDKAIMAGAKGIECDVRLTRDKKPVIYHNNQIKLADGKIKISKHSIAELKAICRKAGHELLVLDDLFDYIKQNKAEFFLELKSSSPALVETIVGKIKEKNLWKKVHITGWSFLLKNALRAQTKYPKLQVGQFLHFPLYSYIKMPKKSHSVFLGWLDGTPGSQRFFKTLISPKRLFKLKQRLEKNGFRVMAGVINNDKGLKLFKEAGINDIVTDRVSETVDFFKQKN